MSPTRPPSAPPTDPPAGPPAAPRVSRRDRPPLMDPDAERMLLGAVMADPALLVDVDGIVTATDFGVPSHREVWAALVRCDAEGLPTDPVTVTDMLSRVGTLDRVGGPERVRELAGTGPADTRSAVAWARIVADHATRRRLIGAAAEIRDRAADLTVEPADALEAAERAVFGIPHRDRTGGTRDMAAVSREVLEHLEKVRTARLLGHSSGFDRLDAMTGGFQPGQLLIVAARPGMGKSALALQLAHRVAVGSGTHVAYLSYEMSALELGLRLVSSTTGIPLSELRDGTVHPDMASTLASAAEAMADIPMVIDDNPPASIGGVMSAMRRTARRVPLGMVVVDYLQLMAAETRWRDASRAQEVGEISRGLKLMARELEIPVVALSQLSRNLESRPGHRPMLSDLRDSGTIEQDADVVLFLHRPSMWDPDADPAAAEMIVAKQRNGPVGTIPLRYEARCVRFTDPAEVGGPDRWRDDDELF